jgi:hypothetical protein
MSKKILIEAFFNQFNSFLGELKQMYPDDPDFPVFMTTLSMMKVANPMLVVSFIKTEIVDPFGAKILARDESFFMGQDYATRNDVDLNIVDKLKEYIQGMSAETKETVWKYIEIISKLCVKALEA